MKRRKFLKTGGTTVAALGAGILPAGALAETAAAQSALASPDRHPDLPPRKKIRVIMRDGVELGGELYLPSESGRFPTLIRKTPYDREGLVSDGQFYATKGYAVVVASQRGRFNSGGVFHQSRNEGWLEHKDGYDTIEWAAAQPWSNGKVGTFGISSDGQWQLATAPTQPPHLRAMFCSYAAHHRIGGRVERGIHTSSGPTWHNNNNAMSRPLRTRDDYRSWLDFWRESQLPFLMTFIHPELIEQFMHSANDEYWRDIDPGTRYGDFDVPAFHESGWYDRYVRATFRNFGGIRSLARTEAARQAQKVIMGPWVHGGNVAPETEAVKFGPAAKVDRRGLHLRWFDYYLKGIDTGVLKDPAVRVYLMGAERWIEADTWPLPDIRYAKYYLRAGSGQPGGSLNGGGLTPEAPGSDRADVYTHDPYDPVPTIGGHGGFGGIYPAGPLDQRPIEPRILTFTTDPLSKDLEVVGEVKARFFASTSAVDTDFVLTLSDVFPNGNSALLRQNAVRGRFRQGEETEALLKPNEVYEFTLDMDGVANLFKAGHRLRLSVASSSFPALLPNPGTALPMHLETKGVTARNTVYHDAKYPSAIEIPVRG